MKGDTHKGELDILRRLDALEAEVFGRDKRREIIYPIPENIPKELRGLGHFWRFPSPGAGVTGEYICDNCWTCSDGVGAKKGCPNPTSYSKGGK